MRRKPLKPQDRNMTLQANLTPDTFWDYTVSRYGKNDMQAKCLYLQNTASVNVNLLLLLCWFMENAFVVTLPQFAQLKAAIAESEDAIHRHRERRKAAHPDAPQGDALLYEQRKVEELILEKAQQRLLLDELSTLSLSHAGSAMNPAIVAFIHLYSLKEKPQAMQVVKDVVSTCTQ